ncbi:MAG TPA: hypothetical protein VF263_21320, partial [Longimicrobiaceae bacterium]
PGGAAAAVYHVDPSGVMAATRRTLAAAGVDTLAVDFDPGLLFVDRDAFRGGRIGADSVLRQVAAGMRRLPGVLRVDRVADLPRADTVRDVIGRRWLHMIPLDVPVELVVTLKPGHVWGRATYAQHGAPHDYDAQVPVIFYGPWFRTGKYSQMARVVDIGPTLARVVGVRPTERLDGRVLEAALLR